jgi:hypothetical protein
MMKYKVLLFIMLFGFNTARAQTDWKLSAEQDGIKIFNGPIAASKVKPIKVECTFNATAAQLVAVLLDIKTYPDWVYHTRSATLIKQVSPAELFYHSELDIPWPAQNRDFVAHLTITQNADKTITVDAPSVPGMVAVKKGVTRIYESKGKWILTPVGNQVKVVYYLQIDAGGGAPSWLVNLFAADGPMQTFKNLKVQLQKPAYKNASFPGK